MASVSQKVSAATSIFFSFYPSLSPFLIFWFLAASVEFDHLFLQTIHTGSYLWKALLRQQLTTLVGQYFTSTDHPPATSIHPRPRLTKLDPVFERTLVHVVYSRAQSVNGLQDFLLLHWEMLAYILDIYWKRTTVGYVYNSQYTRSFWVLYAKKRFQSGIYRPAALSTP